MTLAWSSLAAAAIALIAVIYFIRRALTIHERQKESALEFEGDASGHILDKIVSQIT